MRMRSSAFCAGSSSAECAAVRASIREAARARETSGPGTGDCDRGDLEVLLHAPAQLCADGSVGDAVRVEHHHVAGLGTTNLGGPHGRSTLHVNRDRRKHGSAEVVRNVLCRPVGSGDGSIIWQPASDEVLGERVTPGRGIEDDVESAESATLQGIQLDTEVGKLAPPRGRHAIGHQEQALGRIAAERLEHTPKVRGAQRPSGQQSLALRRTEIRTRSLEHPLHILVKGKHFDTQTGVLSGKGGHEGVQTAYAFREPDRS